MDRVPPPLTPKIRVLIVDDEPDLCDYLAMLLSQEGYDPVTVTDSRKALSTFKASEFHLVILDMMMPGLNGAELMEQIRKIDSDVAIIVSTAHPAVDTAIASLKNRVSDYLRKPFEPDVFLDVVRRALEARGLSVSPETELHETIGASVRNGRKELDLTLKQLARRTGLSVSLLSQIERAESSPSISSLFRIASALGVKISDLFGRF